MRTDYRYTHPESKTVVMSSPDAVPQPEDRAAIVRYIAHQILQSELEWAGLPSLEDNYPALKGLTREQIDTAIADALA